MKNILLTTIILLSSNVSATSFMTFVSSIQRRCNLDNTLLVKKSYLSLLKDSKTCDNSFVSNLLNSCENLNCEILMNEFTISQNEKSGNLIGGEQ